MGVHDGRIGVRDGRTARDVCWNLICNCCIPAFLRGCYASSKEFHAQDQRGASPRTPPASVRFLARRVYWGAVVVLATALCSGVNLRRGRQLSEQLGVPVLTILRWRQWWLTRFTTSAVARSARAVCAAGRGERPTRCITRARGGRRAARHGAVSAAFLY